MWLSWLEHRTVTPLTQVRFPGAAREFLPRVHFHCRLPFGVRTPPCAIACNNICEHDKDPVVHVRVRRIMATQTYPARTLSDKNNQLDCGRSTERTSGHQKWTVSIIILNDPSIFCLYPLLLLDVHVRRQFGVCVYVCASACARVCVCF